MGRGGRRQAAGQEAGWATGDCPPADRNNLGHVTSVTSHSPCAARQAGSEDERKVWMSNTGLSAICERMIRFSIVK